MKKYLSSSKMVADSDSIQRCCDRHLRLFSDNIVLSSGFSPRDLNIISYQSQPRFLPKEAYLRREETKEDLRKFVKLWESCNLYGKTETIYVNLDLSREDKSFYLPCLGSLTSSEEKLRVKIPFSEKYILLGYPEGFKGNYPEVKSGQVFLFPGKVSQVEDEFIYSSFSLEIACAYLDNKTNYMKGIPTLSIETNETLSQLKQKLVSYLRSRIKWDLQLGETALAELYRFTENRLPLEARINNIVEGRICPKEIMFLREFPLIFTPITQEVLIYVNEKDVVIGEASRYYPEDEGDEYLLLNPTLAVEEKSGDYTIPLMIEMRALTVNYAYQILDQEYEDFLGEVNWIISPLTLRKRNGMLHGYLKRPPYYILDVLV